MGRRSPHMTIARPKIQKPRHWRHRGRFQRHGEVAAKGSSTPLRLLESPRAKSQARFPGPMSRQQKVFSGRLINPKEVLNRTRASVAEIGQLVDNRFSAPLPLVCFRSQAAFLDPVSGCATQQLSHWNLSSCVFSTIPEGIRRCWCCPHSRPQQGTCSFLPGYGTVAMDPRPCLDS